MCAMLSSRPVYLYMKWCCTVDYSTLVETSTLVLDTMGQFSIIKCYTNMIRLCLYVYTALSLCSQHFLRRWIWVAIDKRSWHVVSRKALLTRYLPPMIKSNVVVRLSAYKTKLPVLWSMTMPTSLCKIVLEQLGMFCTGWQVPANQNLRKLFGHGRRNWV
jgi:hypothetical protein